MKRYIKSTEDIFGMANLDSKHTGLKCDIWSEHKGCQSNVTHSKSPRVKISVPGSGKIQFELNPFVHIVDTKAVKQKFNKLNKQQQRDILEGVEYVQQNRDVFLKHYNDTDDENRFADIDLMVELSKRGKFKLG